jgi:hypothetical protein
MSKANLVVGVLLGIVLAVAMILASRPVNADAAVVPMERVRVVSQKEAKDSCKSFEVWVRYTYRCSGKPEDYGWWGRHCHRRSLSRPNNVICEQDFFVTNDMFHSQWDCERNREFYAPNGGKPRGLGIRPGSATTKWKCKHTTGFPS